MNKYFCDKCGRELEEKKRKVLQFYNDFVPKQYDFCEECFKKIIKFIKEKNNEL